MFRSPSATRCPSGTFHSGDLVRIKSEAEILSTLDINGTLDRLPFMPEMRKFCGQVFRVHQRAYKTCIEFGGLSSVDRTVFLEGVRCDGSAHASCGRSCLLFWKEAWLASAELTCNGAPSTELGVARASIDAAAARRNPFFCQSTQLEAASKPLPWWNVRQYLLDWKLGTGSVRRILSTIALMAYNKAAPRIGFHEWGLVSGVEPAAGPSLHLQPGEYVRVKTLDAIKKTLDPEGKSRGMLFTPDMSRYCGKVFRVRSRLDHMILENTGCMKKINDTVLLDGVECDGMCRRLCPRRSFFFWREGWLERVSSSDTTPG